jgi:hypothetical protein
VVYDGTSYRRSIRRLGRWQFRDINTFFDLCNGEQFSEDNDPNNVFEDDSFNLTASGYTIDGFDFTPDESTITLRETTKSNVPEPSTLSIFFGAEMLCLGFIRRRRNVTRQVPTCTDVSRPTARAPVH